MKTYKIASIPGDGIGVEVIDAGLRVLEALAERDGGFSLMSPVLTGAVIATSVKGH